jgi:RNA recognition motif-containing protein
MIMVDIVDNLANYRLFISNIPYTASIDDIKRELKNVFSKVCVVDEVYVPPSTITGIFRNFAIVRILATDELKNKCLKVFNGCYLLGSKIRVELCKNKFYKEKLENERIEETKQKLM